MFLKLNLCCVFTWDYTHTKTYLNHGRWSHECCCIHISLIETRKFRLEINIRLDIKEILQQIHFGTTYVLYLCYFSILSQNWMVLYFNFLCNGFSHTTWFKLIHMSVLPVVRLNEKTIKADILHSPVGLSLIHI